MSPGGTNMDSLLLQVHERFPGLKSSIENNNFQEFELFASETRAHSTDRWSL